MDSWLGETKQPVTDLDAGVSRLKRELADSRMERDITKTSRVRCHAAATRYALMATLRRQYPLGLLCRTLDLSRSSYHY